MAVVPVAEQTTILDRMPHRPPMRLITRLLEADAATGEFMAESVVDTANPFCTGTHGLDCLALAEMMAQTFAAGSVVADMDKPADAEPARGFLVGLRDLHFYEQARVGDRLRIRVRLATRIGAFAVCSGQICRFEPDTTETLLAEGQFRLFVPEKGAL